jgi:hypothetical protein
MNMLQVVIGLVFVMLLLSLFATTIMELLAAGLSLRGKNLEKALKNMLASKDTEEKLFKQFKSNALYKQLSQKYYGKRYSPSYMSSDAFQSILFNIILEGQGMEKLSKKLEDIKDENLRQVLDQFLQDTNYDLTKFKKKIQKWYDDVMDRASGWYKRSTQKILIFLGMLIAIVFNADALAIFERLESDPESLNQVVAMAESFVERDSTIYTYYYEGDSLVLNQQAVQVANAESAERFQNALDQAKLFVNDELQSIRSPLGLGWSYFDYKNAAWSDWAMKLLGWVITALAISLGAPFWFDLLRKLVNIRSAGRQSPGES